MKWDEWQWREGLIFTYWHQGGKKNEMSEAKVFGSSSKNFRILDKKIRSLSTRELG